MKETFRPAAARCREKDLLYYQDLITLFFYTAAKYIEYHPTKTSDVCTEMFKYVQETLSRMWIQKLFPYGFGNSFSKKSIHVGTAKKELMVSVTIATIDGAIIMCLICSLLLQ